MDVAISRLTNELRSAIEQGDFLPNERLVESDLVTRYNAGRTEVRASLAALAHEGLVVREANRGARVRLVSTDEAMELNETQLTVEGLCAARAAERANEQQRHELSSILDRMERAAESFDILGYIDFTHDFHACIRRISGQEVAARVAERLLRQRNQSRLPEILAAGRLPAILKEHKAIVAAILARDPVRAENAMRRNREQAVRALRRLALSPTNGRRHPSR